METLTAKETKFTTNSAISFLAPILKSYIFSATIGVTYNKASINTSISIIS